MRMKDNQLSDLSADIMQFLIEKEQPWSEVLADVLGQHDIPFYKKGDMGAGLSLKVGPMLERFRFYVPQRCFEEAQSIVDELFSEK